MYPIFLAKINLMLIIDQNLQLFINRQTEKRRFSGYNLSIYIIEHK